MQVKIQKRKDGLFVIVKQGGTRGGDTAAKDRTVLEGIAARQGWTVVKQWS